MTILSATIFKFKDRAGKIILHTNLPSPCPNIDKGNLTVEFTVEKGKEEEYFTTHFIDSGLLKLADVKVIEA